MRVVQGLGDLGHDPERFVGRDAAGFLDPLPEAARLDQFVHQVALFAVGDELEGADDVGVLEFARGPELAGQPLVQPRIL